MKKEENPFKQYEVTLGEQIKGKMYLVLFYGESDAVPEAETHPDARGGQVVLGPLETYGTVYSDALTLKFEGDDEAFICLNEGDPLYLRDGWVIYNGNRYSDTAVWVAK